WPPLLARPLLPCSPSAAMRKAHTIVHRITSIHAACLLLKYTPLRRKRGVGSAPTPTNQPTDAVESLRPIDGPDERTYRVVSCCEMMEQIGRQAGRSGGLHGILLAEMLCRPAPLPAGQTFPNRRRHTASLAGTN